MFVNASLRGDYICVSMQSFGRQQTESAVFQKSIIEEMAEYTQARGIYERCLGLVTRGAFARLRIRILLRSWPLGSKRYGREEASRLPKP